MILMLAWKHLEASAFFLLLMFGCYSRSVEGPQSGEGRAAVGSG